MKNHAQLLWDIADILRGPYKAQDFAKIVLPFTLLRRVLMALEADGPKMEAYYNTLSAKGLSEAKIDDRMRAKFPAPGKLQGQVWTRSAGTWKGILQQPKSARRALSAQIMALSPNLRDVFARFDFEKTVESLDQKKLLLQILARFDSVDLSPAVVSNTEMGHIFEELIRKFAEQSNETAGEHFTPREVIYLMVELLFAGAPEAMLAAGLTLGMYDPTAGTGGMLSCAEEHVETHYPKVQLALAGQEINDQSYAVCKADLILKGHSDAMLYAGDTLTEDGAQGKRFDLMLSNPPFGVDWKKVQEAVKAEHALGAEGRFGPGLPRVNDGQLLFVLHLVSKMHPKGGRPSRVAIVTNGGPLFSGDAGSGESEIRRYLFENDLVEAIVALPGDLFYNTGIATYIWILSNHKAGGALEGKVALINAEELGRKMRRSLGRKTQEITSDDIATIRAAYANPMASEMVKVLPTTALGYRQIQVDVPRRDATGALVWKDKKATRPDFDAAKREWENIPLDEDVHEYIAREVHPYVPDAVVQDPSGSVGYAINFNEWFFTPAPVPPVAALASDIREHQRTMQSLLDEVLGC